MARLQDFQTVTPTSSDKLLVVQSQGQGLVPYGSKLDSANPTGTGSLSLNRKANTTTGAYSVAEGLNCTASASYSHAEGQTTTASGYHAHAEGQDTQASGNRAHAEGQNTKASANYSHAEGRDTEANGIQAHAEGYGTKASRASQHVFGEYNVEETGTATTRGTYVEIVGKGTADNARSNARTLDWSGNEVLAGDCTIKGNQSVEDGIKGTRDYLARDTTVSTPMEVLQNKYSEIYSRYGSLRMAMFRIGTSTYDYGCVGYIHGANYASFIVFGYAGGALHIKNVNGTWSQTALS